MDLSNITNTKTITLTNCLVNNGTLTAVWRTNVNLPFKPDFAIIRDVVFNTTQAADKTVYVVQSDLSADPLFSFPGTASGFSKSIGNIIKLGSMFNSISCQIMEIDTTGKLIPTTVMGGGGVFAYISITIDLVQLKNKS